jgi:hypothetical protein
MNEQDISQAKNKDLVGSWAAIQRAARMARDVAIQTNTAIIIEKDGVITRVTAEELRQEDLRHPQQVQTNNSANDQ